VYTYVSLTSLHIIYVYKWTTTSSSKQRETVG